MANLADWKAEEAATWGAAPWQDWAPLMSDIHDRLVDALAPLPGERWLDVATGTGAVAIRAARAGSDVTGQDFAPDLIDTARRIAAAEGVAVAFDVGDAESLPYEDGSFEVVSSAHGVPFAPSHEAVARELARVCRRGGRLGLTYWVANATPELSRLMSPLNPSSPDDVDSPRDWGRPEYVRALLQGDFELELLTESSWVRGATAEDVWRLFVTSQGHAKTGLAALAPGERDALRAGWIDYLERNRGPEGVAVERPYLMVLGRRRA